MYSKHYNASDKLCYKGFKVSKLHKFKAIKYINDKDITALALALDILPTHNCT